MSPLREKSFRELLDLSLNLRSNNFSSLSGVSGTEALRTQSKRYLPQRFMFFKLCFDFGFHNEQERSALRSGRYLPLCN
jgi:hypothetical protein